MRQAALQEEARAFAEEHRVEPMLAQLGRVIPVGSAVSGLMVWRDLDYGVDAPGLQPARAWSVLAPLAARADSLHYSSQTGERVGETAPYERLYFVLRLAGWKLDLSLWTAGAPHIVEDFPQQLRERLDPETRLVVLRLKDAWHRDPRYPETISAWEIYDAVLEHGVRTLAELDAYLATHGLPIRGVP